jgi:hypothetical protein
MPTPPKLNELEAVNLMLRAIGQSGVASLTAADTNTDAEAALTQLRDTSRQFQMEGWEFNTEGTYQEPWIIEPDTEGNINLPYECLSVDAVDCTERVSQRGSKLYNLDKRTFAFSDPVKLTLVVALAYEDMPVAAREYIRVKAARQFAADRGGSLSRELSYEKEVELRIKFEQSDSDVADKTLASSSGHMARMRRR